MTELFLIISTCDDGAYIQSAHMHYTDAKVYADEYDLIAFYHAGDHIPDVEIDDVVWMGGKFRENYADHLRKFGTFEPLLSSIDQITKEKVA